MSNIDQSDGLKSPFQSFFGKANEKQLKLKHRHNLSSLYIHKNQNINLRASPQNQKIKSAINKSTSIAQLRQKFSVLLNCSSSFIQKPDQSSIKIIPIQSEKRIRKKSNQDREMMKRNLLNKVIQAQKALQEIKINFNLRLQEKQQILKHKNSKQTQQIAY